MLKGKVALVTGSTSGIGLGIARTLAAEGADVVLNGFGDATAIESLQREIREEHGVRVDYSAAEGSWLVHGGPGNRVGQGRSIAPSAKTTRSMLISTSVPSRPARPSITRTMPSPRTRT